MNIARVSSHEDKSSYIFLLRRLLPKTLVNYIIHDGLFVNAQLYSGKRNQFSELVQVKEIEQDDEPQRLVGSDKLENCFGLFMNLI